MKILPKGNISMPKRFKIATALTALAAAYGLGYYPQRRKYNQIARVLLVIGSERDMLENQIKYLAILLKEKEVEFDEFDLIMLNDPPKQES